MKGRSPLPEDFPKLSLVIGGARSGKSRMAEALAQRAARPKTYVATAEAWDDEMRQWIIAHRVDRGAGWHLIEAPRDLPAALASSPPSVVLIDCATLWLTNLMLSEADIAAETAGLLAALRASPNPAVIVTNDLGMSIVPENALARRFRDDQGRLNQMLGAQAELVLAVIAGVPLVLKGLIPGGPL